MKWQGAGSGGQAARRAARRRRARRPPAAGFGRRPNRPSGRTRPAAQTIFRDKSRAAGPAGGSPQQRPWPGEKPSFGARQGAGLRQGEGARRALRRSRSRRRSRRGRPQDGRPAGAPSGSSRKKEKTGQAGPWLSRRQAAFRRCCSWGRYRRLRRIASAKST